MPFSIRPYRRFPVQCAVTYSTGTFRAKRSKRTPDSDAHSRKGVLAISNGRHDLLGNAIQSIETEARGRTADSGKASKGILVAR